MSLLTAHSGWVSLVIIATGYRLDGPEFEWGVIFRTGPDRPWVTIIFLYNGYRFISGSRAVVAWP